MKNKIIIFVIFLSLMINLSYAYKMEPPNEVVHQHISKEAVKAWPSIPNEIREQTENSIDANLDTIFLANYDSGDDIITGSGEEDYDFWVWYKLFTIHYWNPDDPDAPFTADFNDGLLGGSSSYHRAYNIWRSDVLPNYHKGNKEEAYYWFGRMVHLLQDSTVPAHTLLDPHGGGALGGDDVYEWFLVDEDYWGHGDYNYKYFDGSDYSGDAYNYDNLINSFSDSTWEDINPRIKEVSYPKELFKLFWYTAQKSQYFASDDRENNSYYLKSGSSTKYQLPNLWTNEGLTSFVTQSELQSEEDDNEGPYVEKIANYSMPHAIKTTAGLYKWFWDAANSYHWPTYHHDNKRAGYTLLRGDMDANNIAFVNYTIDDVIPGAIDHPSIADLDGNGKQEIVITTSKYTSPVNGTVYSLERSGSSFTKKWHKTLGTPIPAPPSLADINDDGYKDVIFGMRNMSLFALDGEDGSILWTYWTPERWTDYTYDYEEGDLGYTAIEDIDLDGDLEIIFTDAADSSLFYDWGGRLHILSKTGSLEHSIEVGNGGAWGAPAIGNVDSDDYPEIFVPTFYGIKAYDFTGSSLSLKWYNSDGKIEGAPVLYDVDYDGEDELIYTTSTKSCPGAKTCYDRIYIRDAETGSNEANSPISLSYVSRVAPAVANLIDDNQTEIVVQAQDSTSSEYGRILCYIANTGSSCSGSWPYTNSGNLKTFTQAPVIVDIDNDGDFNVVFGAKDNKTYILDGDGTKVFDYQFSAQLGSSPAIGDINGKGVAEIVVKHAGSPVNILTTLSGTNNKPVLNNISNISANEGDLININASGEVIATDIDNNTLTIYYDAPFNSSALWHTNCNDSGNYSIMIEVSDGNLSDWQIIHVEVNETCSDTSEEGLSISSFTNLTLDSNMIYELVVNNTGSSAISDITWQFDPGDGNPAINSSSSLNLSADETARLYIEYNYSSQNSITATVTVFFSSNSTSEQLPVSFSPSEIDLKDFKIIYRGPKQRIFEFIINNTLATQLTNITWILDTGVENITSSSSVSLNGSESIFVQVEYNYSDIEDYTATATATNATTQDSETVNVKIKEIAVSDLRDLMKSTNQRLFEFIVTNNLDTNLTNAMWNISFGDNTTAESTTPLTLEPNEQAFIYVQTNYSAGSYTVNATAWNSTTTDSDILDVII